MLMCACAHVYMYIYICIYMYTHLDVSAEIVPALDISHVTLLCCAALPLGCAVLSLRRAGSAPPRSTKTAQHGAEDSTTQGQRTTAHRRGQYCTQDSTTQRTVLHRGQHNAEDSTAQRTAQRRGRWRYTHRTNKKKRTFNSFFCYPEKPVFGRLELNFII